MNKKQAKSRSLGKWIRLKDEFEALYEKTNEPCGYCDYSLQRVVHTKCQYCRENFPEVEDVCHEMINEFTDIQNRTDNMISKLKQVLSNQSEAEDE